MRASLGMLALVAASAAATDTCSAKGTAREANGCCVCNIGYEGDECDVCTAGFRMDGAGNCGNGHFGTPCEDDLPFPYHGCGGRGTCSVAGDGAKQFPCLNCPGGAGNCGATAGSQCTPAGARFFTPDPNAPVVGVPYNLIVAGCELLSDDEYLLLNEGMACPTGGSSVNVGAACSIVNPGAADAPVSLPEIPTVCPNGILLSQGVQGDPLDTQRTGMSEVTFRHLQSEAAGTHVLCHRSSGTWSEVRSSAPSKAAVSGDRMAYEVCDDKTCGGAVNGGATADDGSCHCDGLWMGFCLPTWLLVLMMLGCSSCCAVLLWLNFNRKEKYDPKEAKMNHGE